MKELHASLSERAGELAAIVEHANELESKLNLEQNKLNLIVQELENKNNKVL